MSYLQRSNICFNIGQVQLIGVDFVFNRKSEIRRGKGGEVGHHQLLRVYGKEMGSLHEIVDFRCAMRSIESFFHSSLWVMVGFVVVVCFSTV